MIITSAIKVPLSATIMRGQAGQIEGGGERTVRKNGGIGERIKVQNSDSSVGLYMLGYLVHLSAMEVSPPVKMMLSQVLQVVAVTMGIMDKLMHMCKQ